MYLETLDVINTCLETLGEVPLNAADTDHPYAGAITRLLRTCNYRVQATGWWFNKERITLSPNDVTGEIYVPHDVLALDTENVQKNYVLRGRRLYDIASESYVFTGDVRLAIVRLIAFEDLPFVAQDYVQAAVVARFVESYDADQSRVQQVRMDYAMAEEACNAEHIRNTNANILRQGGVGMAGSSIRRVGTGRRLGVY